MNIPSITLGYLLMLAAMTYSVEIFFAVVLGLLGGRFLLTAEARYGWASGVLDGSFSGFDKMDLDGLQLVGGIAVRF